MSNERAVPETLQDAYQRGVLDGKSESIERIADMQKQGDKWMIDFGIECAKVAALQAEVDALKSTNVDLEKRCDDFIESLQDSIGGVILKKIVSPEIGFVPEDIKRCIEWLQAKVARLSAPVSMAEFKEFSHKDDWGVECVYLAACNYLILARATPPQDVEKS